MHMRDTDLKQLLQRIDRRGYPAYKETAGAYQFNGYVLSIDHVQGDPFASPSRLSVHIGGAQAGFEKALYDTPWRRTALEDFLLRQFGREIRSCSFQAQGSGKSGLISVSVPGQEVLPRSACTLDQDGGLIVRFQVGFPARGRTVLAEELMRILFDLLPVCIRKTLYARAYPPGRLKETADLADDRRFIRDELPKRGLSAFVADGAVLPRKSGVSTLPMREAVAFCSPEAYAVELTLPHRGRLRGMGIPCGVTLIVGGGYHGKSTLLKALELGVYDHIAGDGREYVITDPTAVKLRAEDGRSIRDTDISMFIRNLPNGKDTVHFFTEDASGSTSQAANTVEAIAAGARVLLIDEDTSATNFMIRDTLMQRVVHRDEEPIIPFIDRVREIYREQGISTILVAGSSGAYFEKADHIIQMKQYLPYDITERAKREAAAYAENAAEAAGDAQVLPVRTEAPDKSSRVALVPASVRREERVRTRTFGRDGFSINREEVQLRFVEQLADAEQVNALAQILVFLLQRGFDGKRSVTECVETLYAKIQEKGFEAFGARGSDRLAMPRKQEIYAMLNRCRGLFQLKEG